MDRDIVSEYMRCVGNSDRVVFLGDLSFYPREHLVSVFSSLPGRKVLVRGNHDRRSVSVYHEAGFQCVVDAIETTVEGTPVLLTHHPRTLSGRGFSVHGHTHRTEPSPKGATTVDVGVDAWSYSPVSSRELARVLRTLV